MKQVIIIEDGIIQEILSEEKTCVVVVDRDIDGLDETDISVVEAKDSYIYCGITESTVDPERVKQIYQEAGRE